MMRSTGRLLATLPWRVMPEKLLQPAMDELIVWVSQDTAGFAKGLCEMIQVYLVSEHSSREDASAIGFFLKLFSARNPDEFVDIAGPIFQRVWAGYLAAQPTAAKNLRWSFLCLYRQYWSTFARQLHQLSLQSSCKAVDEVAASAKAIILNGFSDTLDANREERGGGGGGCCPQSICGSVCILATLIRWSGKEVEGEVPAEFQAATSVIIHEGLTCAIESSGNSQAAGISAASLMLNALASISFWPIEHRQERRISINVCLDKLLTMNFRSGDGGSSSRNAFTLDVGEPFAHACSLCTARPA